MLNKIIFSLIFISSSQLYAKTAHLFYKEALLVLFDENEPELQNYKNNDFRDITKLKDKLDILLEKLRVQDFRIREEVISLFNDSLNVYSILFENSDPNFDELANVCLYSNASIYEECLVREIY